MRLIVANNRYELHEAGTDGDIAEAAGFDYDAATDVWSTKLCTPPRWLWRFTDERTWREIERRDNRFEEYEWDAADRTRKLLEDRYGEIDRAAAELSRAEQALKRSRPGYSKALWRCQKLEENSGFYEDLDLDIDAEQSAAIHSCLRFLSDRDDDRAHERNGFGFSKIDTIAGNFIANEAFIAPELLLGSLALVIRYRKQLPKEIYAAATVRLQEPKHITKTDTWDAGFIDLVSQVAAGVRP